MQNTTDKIASTHLGKRVSGSEVYDPSLLVAIPREENRKQYQISNEDLPFVGCDIWHAYEFSALTANGIPVTHLLKLKINCNSKFLIESKSLKLYLNSFNMTKFGKTRKDCLEICKEKIQTDLSKKLQTEVEANFLENKTERADIFGNFLDLASLVNEEKIQAENYKESPELLTTKDNKEVKEHYLTFDSLRSNCRVTHQPDFGDAFIYYKSKRHILEDGLLKYLISFRSEFHFHEECCEMIFKRLSDLLDEGDELFVCALYTRRGGIDICPVRMTKNCEFDGFLALTDLKKFARCGVKQ